MPSGGRILIVFALLSCLASQAADGDLCPRVTREALHIRYFLSGSLINQLIADTERIRSALPHETGRWDADVFMEIGFRLSEGPNARFTLQEIGDAGHFLDMVLKPKHAPDATDSDKARDLELAPDRALQRHGLRRNGQSRLEKYREVYDAVLKYRREHPEPIVIRTYPPPAAAAPEPVGPRPLRQRLELSFVLLRNRFAESGERMDQQAMIDFVEKNFVKKGKMSPDFSMDLLDFIVTYEKLGAERAMTNHLAARGAERPEKYEPWIDLMARSPSP